MARQIINIGAAPNDRTGDPLRTAFTKTNENFNELYANVATITGDIITDVSELTDTQGILFSGNYADLIGKPFIPQDVSDLTDTTNKFRQKEYIRLTGTYSGDNIVTTFVKQPYTQPGDYFDTINDQIAFTRAENGGGIYNIDAEDNWDSTISPVLTLWNWDGWNNLTDVKTRYYETFNQLLKNNIDQNIVGAELVMKDVVNNEYYKFKFTSWAQGTTNDGSFAYTREKIDTTNTTGIVFSDGSLLAKSPDNRVKFPQSYVGNYNDYVLGTKDAGRQIYTYGNTLDLPSSAQQRFVIGDTIQIITGDIATTIRPIVNNNPELPDAVLYVQGRIDPVSSFSVPARSMAILTKTGFDEWQLSIGNYVNYTSVPVSSVGSPGDRVGMISSSESHFYYCTQDYTDGLTNIWKRVAFSNDTW